MRSPLICYTAWLAFFALCLLWGTMEPPTAHPRPTLNKVDHPRCFPEGTLATEGFPLCPDSLPDMRSV